jgi:ribosome-associated protein
MAEHTDEMSATSPTPETELPVSPELRRKVVRRDHEAQDPVPSHAVARTTPERMTRALEHARIGARIADDNRGKDVLLLDLRQVTPLVDFFVIITASSRRLSNAIAEEIDKEMKHRGEHKMGMEGSEVGRWILIDYGDFVVHVFSPEARTYYSLEDIWGDAPRLDWQDPAHVRPASHAQPETETETETETESETESESESESEPATGTEDDGSADVGTA